MKKLGIIIVVEAGDLEQKTRLLVESIRTFGGDIADSKIWAVKPRKGKALKRETLHFFKGRGVEFIDINLNKKWYLYGFANKIYATAYIEEKYGSNYEILLFLDCDTVVISGINLLFFEERYALVIKPVDNKFISIGIDEKITEFWRMIYDNCGVHNYKSWVINTTVDNKEIIAHYNSGVIFSRSTYRIFEKWLINFENLTQDYRAYNLTFIQFTLIEQALFAGTVIGFVPKNKVLHLSNNLNFPLTQYKKMNAFKGEIKILHYHNLFLNLHSLVIPVVPNHCWAWLKKNSQFILYRSSKYKKLSNIALYILWKYANIIALKFKGKFI